MPATLTRSLHPGYPPRGPQSTLNQLGLLCCPLRYRREMGQTWSKFVPPPCSYGVLPCATSRTCHSLPVLSQLNHVKQIAPFRACKNNQETPLNPLQGWGGGRIWQAFKLREGAGPNRSRSCRGSLRPPARTHFSIGLGTYSVLEPDWCHSR